MLVKDTTQSATTGPMIGRTNSANWRRATPWRACDSSKTTTFSGVTSLSMLLMKIQHHLAKSGLKNGETVWKNTPISSGMATYLLLNRRLPSRRKNGELAKLAVNMVGKKNDLFLCQFFPPNLHFCFRTLSFVDVDFDVWIFPNCQKPHTQVALRTS